METTTKKIMEEELEGYATRDELQQSVRQSIIRIIETAMEEVTKIDDDIEVQFDAPIPDSDQVYVAGQMNVMMRINDRIQSMIDDIKI